MFLKSRRIFCLVMAVLMIAGLLIGCANQTNDEKPIETSGDPEATTESKYLDGLPESMDLKNEVIRYICDADPNNQLTQRSLISEEKSREILLMTRYIKEMVS